METDGQYVQVIRPIPLRRKILQLDAHILVELCEAGWKALEVTENALPDDAKLVGARYDTIYDRWELAIESETFGEVWHNEVMPILPPVVFTRWLTESHARLQ